MLTVAKLTQGQEQYYERSVAQGLDDYYAGRGESPGVWTGRGAPGLGLEGTVQDGQLGRLCRGRDPLTDERLRRPARERTVTVERIDPYSGTSRLEAKKLAPVCGYDLVFSAPKSVSLLHALGDQHVRHEVNQAHLAAWQAALSYLEDEACIVRKGRNGIDREHGEEFVAAAYQHRTSRAEDPQLHTHVIVANMARTPSDGKWRALDGEALLKTYRLAAGYLYQSHLRHELSERLGVEWRAPVKGLAEIDGFPTEALREFSRRRVAVEQHMAGHDSSGYYAGRVAALATRDRKREIDMPRAIKQWQARAAEHGLDTRQLNATLHRTTGAQPTAPELREIAARLAGPTGLTEKRTSFTTPDLVMAWSERARQGLPADRLRRIADRFLDLDTVQQVTTTGGPGRPARYSTRELIDTELAALTLVKSSIAADAPTAPYNPDPEGRNGITLTDEQSAVAAHASESPDRVVCVVGRAGAGKTTTMHAVADTLHAAGIPVLGAAPSAVAARKLHDGTGIPTLTLHRLNQHERLPDRCVLLVDEASMADTRILARTLQLVDAADGKAILIGDPHQLPAVGAGGLFAAIVQRHGAVELTENHRQHDPLERDVLQRLRDGAGREYLAHAQRTERLIETDDPATTRARLLADWWQHAQTNPAENVMIALKRRDVTDLNQLAHRLMDTAGHLGPDRIPTRHGELAVGDRIVCKRNNTHLGITNGTRGTISKLDTQQRQLTITTDDGAAIQLPAAYLDAGNVHHAYALTGHTTQGLTVDRAFVLATGETRLQEWGYVALSRARTQTRLYVTATARETESHAPTDQPLEPLTRLAQALEESQREHLAVDQTPHSQGPRHDIAPVVERPILGEIARERLRVLDRERIALERTRVLAEHALAHADQARGALRWRRRSHSARDTAEVELRKAALRHAADRLTQIQLERQQLLSQQASWPPDRSVTREPSREPARALAPDVVR